MGVLIGVGVTYRVVGPALEAGGIQASGYGDVLEENVGDVSTSLEGANAHAVSQVADSSVAKDNIVGATSNGTRIVTIVDGTPLDGDVGAANIKSVGVERKGRARGDGVDDGVLDSDVGALKNEVNHDRLGRLPVLSKSYRTCFVSL